jgi:colanic acid/amylovoran biosynthesis glycosyltransferase
MNKLAKDGQPRVFDLKRLAIITPTIGNRSETFIRRHVEDLLPGESIAVATSSIVERGENPDGYWSPDCPVLELAPLRRTFEGSIRWGARRYGLPVGEMSVCAVKRFFKKYDVKVVLGEFLDDSLQWLPIAQKLGIAFFGHGHGYDVSQCLRDERWRKEYLQYNDSAGVVVVSGASRSRLISLGINESKIHVVPCGVDVPNEPRRRTPKETVRCLAVGRMVAKKGPILTLDAFRRAADVCPYLHLDYVGAGELFSSASQFVRAFALESKVTLHGGRSSEFVQEKMNETDIFIQHSMTDSRTGDEEGLPVAILEAMAQSLPVVSTCHAGIPEAVLDGETGSLVDEGDSSAMAQRIVLLARDQELRLKFGLAGWKRAKEEFTWRKERESLLAIMNLNSNTLRQNDKKSGVLLG